MKALLAEDEPIARSLLRAHLRAAGHEPAIAPDGTEAWRFLRGCDEPLLAVLDWMMPGLDGPEICRRLRARAELRGSYVIMVTGRCRQADLVAGLEAGVDDYVTKPFDAGELRARLGVARRVLCLQLGLRRRVAELEAAASRIQRLERLLPICCYCKRIRADDDYWEQVEHYVSARTGARFTHGICPDCFGRAAPTR